MVGVLTVRPSDAGDLAAVDGLLARSYPRLLKGDYPPSVLVTALPIIARARPELVRSGTYYVVESDGAIVGAGGWSHRQASAEIRHVVTDHRVVRQGIGRALIDRVLDEARAAGMGEMVCQSTRTAVPFYLAMGFEVLGAVDVPLRPGISFPAVQMRRDI